MICYTKYKEHFCWNGNVENNSEFILNDVVSQCKKTSYIVEILIDVFYIYYQVCLLGTNVLLHTRTFVQWVSQW